MNKKYIRVVAFAICFLVIFTSGFAFGESKERKIKGKYLIDEYIFYSDGDGSGRFHPKEKEVRCNGKTYEVNSIKYDKIGQAQKIVKKVKLKDKKDLKKFIYTKDSNGKKKKLWAGTEKIKWKKVLSPPKVVKITYKNNRDVPAVIKIDKDGKKVNAKRTYLKKRSINIRIKAPAVFYGSGKLYKFNKKFIKVGDAPTWKGYEKEVIKYLNRNDITKVLGGEWSSGYRNINGKRVRYASYDVLRKESIREAAFTEEGESRAFFLADVEYKDPNAHGKNLIRCEIKYKEKENKLFKVILAGAGILVLSLLIASSLFLISKKKNKKE